MQQAAAPPASPASQRQSAAAATPLPQIALACAIAGVVAVQLVDVNVDVANLDYHYSCLLGQDVGSSSLCT